MTKAEFIELRIAELEARRDYAAQLVMNREMSHEAKMCAAQIKALLSVLANEQRDEFQSRVKPLPKIGPLVQFWCQGSNPQQLIYTDDHGHDTVLCENHLTDALVKCSNCIEPWPVAK